MSPATRAPIPAGHTPVVHLRIRPGLLDAVAAICEVQGRVPHLVTQLDQLAAQARQQQPRPENEGENR